MGDENMKDMDPSLQNLLEVAWRQRPGQYEQQSRNIMTEVKQALIGLDILTISALDAKQFEVVGSISSLGSLSPILKTSKWFRELLFQDHIRKIAQQSMGVAPSNAMPSASSWPAASSSSDRFSGANLTGVLGGPTMAQWTRKEVEDLDVDGVVKFAQEQGLDEEDVAVLRKRKIKGRNLERMTVEKFMADGLERGPAEDLMLALDKVFGRGPGSASGDTENKGQAMDINVLTQSIVAQLRSGSANDSLQGTAESKGQGPCCGYCGSGPFEPLQLNEHIKAMHKELLLVKRRRIGLSGGGASRSALANSQSGGVPLTVQFLGRGVNGWVRLCRIGDESVAIKICSSMDVMKHELSMMRLVQGCPVVSQLVAPQVFGGGIVMSVYEEVSRQNFSFTQACHDLRQAIEHLHRLDICHNDIKPDSIMFDPRSRRFVLIDFSNAQFRDTLVAYADNEFVPPEFRVNKGEDDSDDFRDEAGNPPRNIRPASFSADDYAVKMVIQWWKTVFGVGSQAVEQ